jgi:hypothetical protein
MFRSLVLACAVLAGLLATSSASLSAPSAAASPAPTPDAEAERIFNQAKRVWTAEHAAGVPYINYGALVRYVYHGHVFDNWWDAYYRASDGAMALHRLVDEDEERRRLAGFPLTVFGEKIFDTNRESEPIRIDQPAISPFDSFGLLARPPGEPSGVSLTMAPNPPAPGQSPAPGKSAAPGQSPTPEPTPMRELITVEAVSRDYRIDLIGTDVTSEGDAYHLRLTPLRDPATFRLRDMWVTTAGYETVRLRVQGLFNGKPYDGVEWTVSYVPVEGRRYLEQIKSEAELHFGFDVTIPQMEFDFVDYHFPATVPDLTFEHLL